jgi:hypothetical protein
VRAFRAGNRINRPHENQIADVDIGDFFSKEFSTYHHPMFAKAVK